MPFLIDTNVAIHLRDKDPKVADQVEALGEFPALSVISAVELEGGVYRVPALLPFRRARLDAMLEAFAVIGFGDAEAAAYGRIVAMRGYSRADILDRMIAATAIIHRLTLITMNAKDFRKINGLKLVEWESPSFHPPSAAPR